MRKLAITALAFSAAVFLANFILPAAWLPALAALSLTAAAAVFSMRRKWLRAVVLALLGFGLGLSCFYVHYRMTTEKALLLDGETREITAVLVDYPQVYEQYTRGEVQIQSGDLPRLKMLVYDYSMELSGYIPGQQLRFEAKLSRADRLYGDSYDYYNTRGIYLRGTVRSEITALARSDALRFLPRRLSHRLASYIDQVFPEDTRSFMHGLLLGDKSGLYQDTGLYAAMSRAGFMHVVAVSGMHVSFLVSFVQLALGKRRRSALFCIALVWLFVLTSGASPSAVRAGVMQSFLLFAPLVNRENDPVTSLSAALALLLLFNPHAAASVSLQLSFAAVAGILCLSERIHDRLMGCLPEGRGSRLLHGPVSILASSLGVMVFTVPLTAIHFGYVSLISPITNILGLWAVSLCFCGGFAACAAVLVFRPLGAGLAWLASWLVRFLMQLVKAVAAIPFGVIYFQHWTTIGWLILCYVLFFVFSLTRLSPRRKVLCPLLLSVALLTAATVGTSLAYRARTGTIGILDVGQGQCIAVLSGKQAALIDCGGLGTLDDAGESAAAFLNSRGYRTVHTLVLTHTDTDHVNGIPMLLELMKVERILLPANTDAESETLEQIRACAQRHGTRLERLDADETFTVGGAEFRAFAPDPDVKGNNACLSAVVTLGDYDMLVTGDMSLSAESALLEKHPLQDIELLIVGHHGSRFAASEELLSRIGAHTAAISVGYNNYGQPAPETLARLQAAGYEKVYRTDQDGTVELRIG